MVMLFDEVGWPDCVSVSKVGVEQPIGKSESNATVVSLPP